jgi:hypothetical protein
MDKIELEQEFKPVFDLSGILEKDEIELLGKGLKYGIKNKNFNQFEILARFEEFAQNMIKEPIVEKIIESERYITTPVDSFLQKLQALAYEFTDSAQTPQNSLTFDEEKTLKKLKTLQETKTMSYPVMWKSILITLVTSSAVIVVLSLVAVGLMKLPAMAAILLQLFIIVLSIFPDHEGSYLPENTIPMLKHFGLGGQLFILN